MTDIKSILATFTPKTRSDLYKVGEMINKLHANRAGKRQLREDLLMPCIRALFALEADIRLGRDVTVESLLASNMLLSKRFDKVTLSNFIANSIRRYDECLGKERRHAQHGNPVRKPKEETIEVEVEPVDIPEPKDEISFEDFTKSIMGLERMDLVKYLFNMGQDVCDDLLNVVEAKKNKAQLMLKIKELGLTPEQARKILSK